MTLTFKLDEPSCQYLDQVSSFKSHPVRPHIFTHIQRTKPTNCSCGTT